MASDSGAIPRVNAYEKRASAKVSERSRTALGLLVGVVVFASMVASAYFLLRPARPTAEELTAWDDLVTYGTELAQSTKGSVEDQQDLCGAASNQPGSLEIKYETSSSGNVEQQSRALIDRLVSDGWQVENVSPAAPTIYATRQFGDQRAVIETDEITPGLNHRFIWLGLTTEHCGKGSSSF